jgi:TonB family protein
MMRRREKITIFILFSLLLHLLFLGLGTFFNEGERPKPPPEVEVTILKKPYQIADIAPPEKEEKPKDAKFLGLYDSRVEKEQVAPTLTPSTRKQAGAPEPKKEAPEKTKEKTKEREGEGPKLAAKTPEKKVQPEIEGDETLEALPEDFYPDYKIGDRTYLNVFRFPKIGYFVRLKKIFKTTFNPVPSIRPYIYSNQVSKGQVEVVMAVSIDRIGNLAELFVINSSGLPLYDQEALRTIKDSSPFASPPADLLDKSSKLRMVWTFTVYL